MRKFLSFLIVSLLSTVVLAAELPSEGEFVIVSADGVVAGTGELQGGNLELELLSGFTSFATLTFVGEDGEVLTFDVMVGEDGSVVLTDTFEELASLVSAAGGEVEVSFSEDVDAEGSQAFGAAVPEDVELPEEAVEGMQEAAENAAAAEEQADEAREEAAGDADRGSDAAGDAGAPDDADAADDADGSEEADDADDRAEDAADADDSRDAAGDGDGQAGDGRDNAR